MYKRECIQDKKSEANNFDNNLRLFLVSLCEIV